MIGGEHGGEPDLPRQRPDTNCKSTSSMSFKDQESSPHISCLLGTSHGAFWILMAYHHGLGVIVKALPMELRGP